MLIYIHFYGFYIKKKLLQERQALKDSRCYKSVNYYFLFHFFGVFENLRFIYIGGVERELSSEERLFLQKTLV